MSDSYNTPKQLENSTSPDIRLNISNIILHIPDLYQFSSELLAFSRDSYF